MPPDTKYAKSGDVHIAYQVIGDGPIDLIVVLYFNLPNGTILVNVMVFRGDAYKVTVL